MLLLLLLQKLLLLLLLRRHLLIVGHMVDATLAQRQTHVRMATGRHQRRSLIG